MDMERDGDKTDELLEGMDSCALGPVVRETNTSLRSSMTIDYALTTGVSLEMQTYEEETSREHEPLLCGVTVAWLRAGCSSRTIWPIISFMLTNTFEFWEKEWKAVSFDDTYEMFIVFLLHMPKSMCHPQQKHTLVQQKYQLRLIY